MFNTTRVAPLAITPYASNRSGLFAYANYSDDLEATTVQPIPAYKNTAYKASLLTTPNINPLKIDTFSAHTANTQQAIAKAKNSRVDSATDSKSNRFANVSLKQPAAQVGKSLNFMA
jgi:hypothetical protein